MASAALSADEISDLNFLYNEVHRLRTEWALFEQLFIDDVPPGRIYLHANAPRFMEALRPALAHDMLLTICRLCDPKESCVNGQPRENLALSHFVDVVPSLRPKMDKLTQLYKGDLRLTRNRRGGHNDRKTIRGKEKISAPMIGRMRQAVGLCGSIVTELHKHYGQSHPDIYLELVVNEINWLEVSLRFLNADEKDRDIKRLLKNVKALRRRFERPKKKK